MTLIEIDGTLIEINSPYGHNIEQDIKNQMAQLPELLKNKDDFVYLSNENLSLERELKEAIDERNELEEKKDKLEEELLVLSDEFDSLL